MPAQRLSDRLVASLQPKASTYEVFDRREAGLSVRVTPMGVKTFSLLCRDRDRRLKRQTLGRAGALTVERAREEAQQIKRSMQSRARLRWDAVSHDDAGAPRITNDVLAEYETKYLLINCPRSAKERMRVLRKDFAELLHLPIEEIQKQDILKVTDRLLAHGKPSAALHAFATMRAFLAWTVERGLRGDLGPMRAPVRAKKRERILTLQELGLVGEAVSQIGYPYAPVVRLLILTAQRRDEVAAMRWQDVDLSTGTWTVPREMTKSDRTHLVPLCPQAQAIISALPRLHETWVFPARHGSGHISGWSKWKSELSRLIPNLPPWVLHDLRRTAYSGMSRLGVPFHVKELIVNHARTGLIETYDRYAYIAEKRDALERWAREVASMIGSDK